MNKPRERLSLKCSQCGTPFEATRPDARFCSIRCRVAAHRGVPSGGQRKQQAKAEAQKAETTAVPELARLRARVAALEAELLAIRSAKAPKASGAAPADDEKKPRADDEKKPRAAPTDDEKKRRAAKGQVTAALNALPFAKARLEALLREKEPHYDHPAAQSLASRMHAANILNARKDLARLYARINKYDPQRMAEELRKARADVQRAHPDMGGDPETFRRAKLVLDTVTGRLAGRSGEK